MYRNRQRRTTYAHRVKIVALWLFLFVIGGVFFHYGVVYGISVKEEQDRKLVHDQAVAKLIHDMQARITELEDEHNTMSKLWVNTFGEEFDPKKIRSTMVEVSSYNPLSGQTDSTPFEAAFGNMVKPGILAVPQAYRLKMGWKPFQVVMLEGIGPMVIADHMNDRWGAVVDIICFIPKWSKLWGRKDLRIWWQE